MSATAPPLGINLLTSPGFESGLGDWVASGGAQVVTGNAHTGTHALSLPRYGAAATQVVYGLTPGDAYTFRSYVKVAAGGAVSIGAGGETSSTEQVVTATGYVAVSGIVTVGPNSDWAAVWVWNRGGTAAWADDLELIQLPDPPAGGGATLALVPNPTAPAPTEPAPSIAPAAPLTNGARSCGQSGEV